MTTCSDADRSALQRFLADAGLVDGPVQVHGAGDGRSNLTFVVDDGSRRVVVRRPPPPPVPAGANDVLREAQVLSALAPTGVPVPRVLATAPAGDVWDVPIVVMSFVAGPVVTTTTPSPLDNPQDRRRIGESVVDTLAALHAVDWQRVGLADFGRPDGFNARHVRRMSRLIADDTASMPIEFARPLDRLLAEAPPESGAAIVHNDFRLGNLVLAPDRPGRVAGVLDWELATIGDPLWDVGYLLASRPVQGAPPTPTGDFAAAMLEPGWPSRIELAERYAAVSGRDVGSLGWYTTAVFWKLAVLYEYQRRRAVPDSYYADPRHVRQLLDASWRAADG